MSEDSLPDLRVSTKERDAAVVRLQAAFLEGRLTDSELAERVDKALSARVQSELAALYADLPAAVYAEGPAPQPLKKLSTHKSHAVQQGLWTVPRRFKAECYKSSQIIDLTRAVLTAVRTEIRVQAYKSEVTVVVPDGARVEMRGSGYQSSWSDETLGEGGGPVIAVTGSGYKSRVTVRRGPLNS